MKDLESSEVFLGTELALLGLGNLILIGFLQQRLGDFNHSGVIDRMPPQLYQEAKVLRKMECAVQALLFRQFLRIHAEESHNVRAHISHT